MLFLSSVATLAASGCLTRHSTLLIATDFTSTLNERSRGHQGFCSCLSNDLVSYPSCCCCCCRCPRRLPISSSLLLSYRLENETVSSSLENLLIPFVNLNLQHPVGTASDFPPSVPSNPKIITSKRQYPAITMKISILALLCAVGSTAAVRIPPGAAAVAGAIGVDARVRSVIAARGGRQPAPVGRPPSGAAAQRPGPAT